MAFTKDKKNNRLDRNQISLLKIQKASYFFNYFFPNMTFISPQHRKYTKTLFFTALIFFTFPLYYLVNGAKLFCIFYSEQRSCTWIVIIKRFNMIVKPSFSESKKIGKKVDMVYIQKGKPFLKLPKIFGIDFQYELKL